MCLFYLSDCLNICVFRQHYVRRVSALKVERPLVRPFESTFCVVEYACQNCRTALS